MILAGALGNLYDRLFSVVQVPAPGAEPILRHVRDFIDLSQIGYKWVFNIADALLVIGVGILMILWVLHSKPKIRNPNSETRIPE
jgi:lipoprotein signal peptidase